MRSIYVIVAIISVLGISFSFKSANGRIHETTLSLRPYKGLGASTTLDNEDDYEQSTVPDEILTLRPYVGYSHTRPMNDEKMFLRATTMSEYVLKKREAEWGRQNKLSDKDYRDLKRILGWRIHTKSHTTLKTKPYHVTPSLVSAVKIKRNGKMFAKEADQADSERQPKIIDYFLDSNLIHTHPPKFSEKAYNDFRKLISRKIDTKISLIKQMYMDRKREAPSARKITDLDFEGYKRRLLNELDDRIFNMRNAINNSRQ